MGLGRPVVPAKLPWKLPWDHGHHCHHVKSEPQCWWKLMQIEDLTCFNYSRSRSHMWKTWGDLYQLGWDGAWIFETTTGGVTFERNKPSNFEVPSFVPYRMDTLWSWVYFTTPTGSKHLHPQPFSVFFIWINLNHKHHAIQSQVHFGMAVDADLVRQVLFKRIASLESQGSEFVQEI